MKSQAPDRSSSIRSSYLKSLVTNRGARFVLILLGLAAAVSIVISALTFAQNPGKVLQAESKPVPAAANERPRRSASTRKGPKAKGSRNSDQDQELSARSQEAGAQDERADRSRRDGRPREWRMRKARPFIDVDC